jgi:quinate dehydrogenase
MVYTIATHILNYPFRPGQSTTTSSSLPLPTPRLFLDMAYKPRLTPLLKIAEALGWQPIGGIQAMIEQGLAQQRMWLKGDAGLQVACDKSLLGEETESKARELVEGMKDITPTELEVDRALT